MEDFPTTEIYDSLSILTKCLFWFRQSLLFLTCEWWMPITVTKTLKTRATPSNRPFCGPGATSSASGHRCTSRSFVVMLQRYHNHLLVLPVRWEMSALLAELSELKIRLLQASQASLSNQASTVIQNKLSLPFKGTTLSTVQEHFHHFSRQSCTANSILSEVKCERKLESVP